MKFMLLAAAFLSSVSAFAQTCEVDMVYMNTNQRITTFRAYDMGDGCKEGMKQCRLEIRQRNLVGRADCVRANNIPNPMPNPIPGPNPIPNPYPNPYPPTNPYPQYGVTVTGYIEDRAFEFTARDASELYVNCLTDIRRIGTQSSDELFFTVNGARYQQTSTSGWYNDSMVCSILEQAARNTYNTTNIMPARVVGSLETSPFRFEAYDRASLLRNCVANIASLRLGSTDEMSYSLNGAPFQRLSTSGWWQTPNRVCQAMLINMDARL